MSTPHHDLDLTHALFHEARTHNAWRSTPVSEERLERLYDALKMAPTAMNCQPARLTFIKSAEAKERLKPCLSAGNVDKTMSAPVTVIVAYDVRFYERMGELFHWEGARAHIEGMPEADRVAMAEMNATLQAAYLIIAARALGLDCGPMGGFNKQQVNEVFFPEGDQRALLLINLGEGDPEGLHPRNPRLSFQEACQVL